MDKSSHFNLCLSGNIQSLEVKISVEEHWKSDSTFPPQNLSYLLFMKKVIILFLNFNKLIQEISIINIIIFFSGFHNVVWFINISTFVQFTYIN
jgi:hypothetical protein